MATAGLLSELPRPERLLVVVAHPGDGEQALAGTVARWVGEGTQAQLVCGTSGDASGDDPSADPLALAVRAEAEQRTAAAVVGYQAVTFLHRPEGALVNDLALREQLVRLVRGFRPECVATIDPRVLIDGHGRLRHPDQREIGAAAVDAIPAAARAMAFSPSMRAEGLEPWRVARLILFGSERPTHGLDIGATLRIRRQALAAHRAQGHPGDLVNEEAFELIELG